MKKIFSFVLLTGMLTLMSFNLSSKEDEEASIDCFEHANSVEISYCGYTHCNDRLWDIVYSSCLNAQNPKK